MNKHYNQLGKIFLEKTNPQNPAARRDIAGAKERAKKSGQSFERGSLRRGLAADTARVRRGEKPRHTTKAQGQEAMAADPKMHPAEDPPHPSSSRTFTPKITGKVGLSAERAIEALRAQGEKPKKPKKGEENSWTVYSHMGKLIAEKAEKLDIVQVASRKAADVKAQKSTNTGTPKEQATARRKARKSAVTPGGVRTHLARKIPGVKHSTDKPIISM